MYKRPDGLYEKTITVKGERIVFRAKKESEINKKILAYKGKVEKGKLFKEVAENWKDEHFKTIAYNTIKCYAPACRRAIDEFGEIPIKEIKPNDINAFIVKFPKKGYGQKTTSIQLLVIKLILAKSCIDGEIDTSPADYVKIPKNLPKAKRELPTIEEIETIKNSLNCTFGLFAYFLLYTGCRKGEALALQYKDIDYTTNMIKVAKSAYYVGNKAEIKPPKTAAGIREVILMNRLSENLPSGIGDHYIFGDEKGNPITAKKFLVLWKKYCQETGLTITPHQLRHGYATILFEAGLDEKDAQELMGHANISTTHDIYTHISKTRKSKAAELLNNYDG